MTPHEKLIVQAMCANYAWMLGVPCLLIWAYGAGQNKDPLLYAAVGFGIVFGWLLHRIAEGRGLWRALGLMLLTLVSCIFTWSSTVLAGAAVGALMDHHALTTVHIWSLLIAGALSLICCARLKRIVEDDEPWLPVTRSWFGRQVTSPDLLDCPCGDEQRLIEARAMIARLEGKCERLEDKCERLALDAKHSRAGQLEEIEAILTLPGVREKLRSLAHPDKHPEATPAEKRRFNEMFQKLTAIYDRLGKGR